MPRLEPEAIRARIEQSIEKGTTAFLERGGFSTINAFYFSFADPDKPKGQQWLGGCYIRADTVDEASVLTRILDINPGGQVLMRGPFSTKALVPEYEHRLLTTMEDVNRGIDAAKLQERENKHGTD